MSAAQPRIGIALGSGSARGWSHIGVLRALGDIGIEPDVVCGTSIGALVGAAYVVGQLEALETWVRAITPFDIVGLMDVTLARGGVIAGAKLLKGLRNVHMDVRIEDLGKPFAAVATDFATGRELWLQKGPLLEAVRASISLPGIFPPLKVGGQWLLDGGLVNPVPVSVCRALGADVVIAVNLNGDLTSRNAGPRAARQRTAVPSAAQADLLDKLSARLNAELRDTTNMLATQFLGTKRQKAPGFFDVLAGAIYIMQDRITRSRMAGDPPDVLLAPRLGYIRLLDFHRGEEAIAQGRACVAALEPALQQLLSPGGAD